MRQVVDTPLSPGPPSGANVAGRGTRPGAPHVCGRDTHRPRPAARAAPGPTSGARGFIAKGAPGTALPDVVRRVHDGQRYVDPILAADALTAPPSPLTPRESEVLAVALEDRPIREVARTVFLSPGTVRNHLAAITHKLGAGSRAEAYHIARDNGWL